MKNIIGVAFSILITAHLGNAQELQLFFITLKKIIFALTGNYVDDFLNIKCPGVCLSEPFSNICQVVYNNAGCPSSRTCCVFLMHIELNLPNTTEPTPLPVSQLTVNIPGESTITVKDKETSTVVGEPSERKGQCPHEMLLDGEACDDDIPITTNIPSSSYETTEGLELEREKNKISLVTKSPYVDSLISDLVVPSQTIRTTEHSIPTLSTTSGPQKSSGRECTGECVKGLYSLLCHNIDTDASCPSEERCCLQPMATKETTSSPTTTQ